MIHVDRGTVTPPAVLDRRFRDGKTETDRAKAHYDPNQWDGETSFKWTRYSDDEVKEKLEELFAGKCAYCESRFRHVSPEDVEHWRPKGAVVLEDGSERKPAYFWLGATWTNLLSSCPDCNRRRRQEDVRDPVNEQSGKKDYFPVDEEADRWTHFDQPDRNGEVALLLDPCSDSPEEFLTVDDDAVVHEKHPADTLENRRAQQSIDIYGLNRSALVDERKKHFDRVQALLHDIRLGERRLAAGPALLAALPPGPLRDDQEAQLDEAREALRTKLGMLKDERRPGSPYLMIKAPLIEDFMATMAPKLDALQIV